MKYPLYSFIVRTSKIVIDKTAAIETEITIMIRLISSSGPKIAL
jgi:hypothetical protein